MLRIVFLLMLSFIVWGCSLKHKIHELYKEQLTTQQVQESLQTMQYRNLIWDHNSEEYQKQKSHYQVWDLQGAVTFLPDGHIQAQSARIHTWNKESDIQQNQYSHVSNTTGRTHKKENTTTSFTHFIKTKYIDKYKRYSSWWIVGLGLVLIGLVILKVRRK